MWVERVDVTAAVKVIMLEREEHRCGMLQTGCCGLEKLGFSFRDDLMLAALHRHVSRVIWLLERISEADKESNTALILVAKCVH